MSTDFLLQLVTAIGSAVMVYGAIRADLARAIAKAEAAQEAASKAHDRIDRLQEVRAR